MLLFGWNGKIWASQNRPHTILLHFLNHYSSQPHHSTEVLISDIGRYIKSPWKIKNRTLVLCWGLYLYCLKIGKSEKTIISSPYISPSARKILSRCKLELEDRSIGLDFITIDEFPWYFSLGDIKYEFNMQVVQLPKVLIFAAHTCRNHVKTNLINKYNPQVFTNLKMLD